MYILPVANGLYNETGDRMSRSLKRSIVLYRDRKSCLFTQPMGATFIHIWSHQRPRPPVCTAYMLDQDTT